MNTIINLGIPTRDRPTQLARAVESCCSRAQGEEGKLTCCVLDDSRRAAERAANQEIVRRASGRFPGRWFYADRSARVTYADELIRESGLMADVVRFALLGEGHDLTVGAARNTLLLASTGELSLQLDDDTTCEPVRPPGHQPGHACLEHDDAEAYWFYGSRDEANAAARYDGIDLLCEHERILGGTDLASYFDKAGVSAPAEARVLATFAGVAGDIGMHHHAWRLFLRGDSLARLTRDETEFALGIATREVIRAAPRLTFCRGPHCMATHIGLATTHLLPPFMPVLRNEDGVFGAALFSIRQDAWKAYLPYAVRHDPPTFRGRKLDLSTEASAPRRANDLLTSLILSFSWWPGSDNTEIDMRALGGYLKEMGMLRVQEFREVLKALSLRSARDEAVQAEHLLETSPVGLPGWRDLLRHYSKARLEAATSPGFVVPADLVGNPEDRLETLRHMVTNYGRLLDSWPLMVEAALRLRQQGIRVGVAL